MAQPDDDERLPRDRGTAASLRWMVTAMSIGLVVVALYIGRDLFMPFALAVLLSFVLDPLVTRLCRWRVPRVAAVVVVMSFTVTVVGALSLFLGNQVVLLARDLPAYEQTIHSKVLALRKTMTQRGVLTDVGRLFDVFETELDAARESLEKRQDQRQRPLRVEIEPPRQSPLQALAAALGPLMTPLLNAGIVFVFVVFILIERSDLRDRLLSLVGGNIRRSTEATNDAAQRVSRYLSMQMLVNVGYAIPMALGLALIGVPGALLWGTLAGVLRFLPYAGPMIGATLPLVMAVAVDPGWSMLLWAAGFIVTLELISNNIIEPWLYGSSTGLAPVAVLMSATFWALLWGPVGLILATPLTVCLVVMAKHIAPLRFFDVLLGSEPVFDAPTRLYQRLLAGDVEESIELAGEQVAQGSLLGFYGDVALPALCRAADEHGGRFQSGRFQAHQHRLVDGMTLLLSALREDAPAATPAAATPGTPSRVQALCIGARSEMDTLGADMWAHALGQRQLAADWLPNSAIMANQIAEIGLPDSAVVCLSYFSDDPQAHIRYVCKRLRRRRPSLRIVLGLWRATDVDFTPAERDDLGIAAVTHGLDDAVQAVARLLALAPVATHAPAANAALAPPVGAGDAGSNEGSNEGLPGKPADAAPSYV